MQNTKAAADTQTGIFERFVHSEVAASGLLLVATVAAFAVANSPWAPTYFSVARTTIGPTIGGAHLALTVQQWINDLLMAVFFFVVGLEIKRELVVGQLSSPRLAALPVMAALGGMLVPALFYAALNAGGPGAHGWGIPMATDIAFALGVLAVLRSRAPAGLKVFLTALAIVDDLGAVAVIAAFYSGAIRWVGLGVAAAAIGAIVLVNRAGITSRTTYIALAVMAWGGVLASGVHATVAGVLVAMVVPVRERDGGRAPGLALEEAIHPWVALGILPLFAFFNAGVPLGSGVADLLAGPVATGVVLGLVLGKPIGICVFCAAAVGLGFAALPQGVRPVHIVGGGCLAGIGFTMSLFVTELAFDTPALGQQAKLAIVSASIVAAILGAAVLMWVGARSPNDVRDGESARQRPVMQ